MYKAPSPRTMREIQDSSGSAIGRSDGFRPDPATGSLGLEVELSPAAAEAIGTEAASVWMPQRWVAAVRRDAIVLDRSLTELTRLLAARGPALLEPADA